MTTQNDDDDDDDVNRTTGTETTTASTSPASTFSEKENNNNLLQTFIGSNPLVFEREVLPILSFNDLGLFARTSRGCKAAVVESGLAAAGVTEEYFTIEHFLGSEALLVWAEKNGYPFRGRIFHIATTLGNVEALDWAVTRGYSWEGYRRIICQWAVVYGQLEVLKWARERHGCPWDTHTCAAAVIAGHLDILKYLRAAGCPWNQGLCRFLSSYHGDASKIYRWVKEQPE